MKNLAIIPARSGSKGVQNKNIKELNGRPLMAYTIEAALESKKFAEVMVSTDSPLYARIAQGCGAVVPFLRSEAASADTAGSWEMVSEVLKGYGELGKTFDTFCLLQPTSPLRTAEDIVRAYALYEEKAASAVVSVCEAEHSPLWCGQLPEDLGMEGFISPQTIWRRQQGGKFYRLNGAVYIVDTARFMEDQFLYQKGSYAYIMDQDRSIDIDTELDFELAKLYQVLNGNIRF